MVLAYFGLGVTFLQMGTADNTFFGMDEAAALPPSSLNFKKSSALHCAMTVQRMCDSCKVFSFDILDQTCTITSYLSLVMHRPMLKAPQNAGRVSQFMVSTSVNSTETHSNLLTHSFTAPQKAPIQW